MTNDLLKPATVEEAAAAIAEARAAGKKLAIEGNGSKAVIGRHAGDEHNTLSSAKLSGMVQYNPAELVFVAQAGTAYADIEKQLAKNNQRLAFEPPDYGRLLGTDAPQTIGGIAATNLSGPRRLVAGAARDSLLGVRFINGAGEHIKNGGQVMKNVTGLDLVKLMAGSWGTLGFLTEVSFKVLPSAETEKTLVIEDCEAGRATALMAAAMGTSCDVSGAAFVAAGMTVAGVAGPAAVLRLEGFEASVDDRLDRLTDRLDVSGLTTQILDGATSSALWTAIRDVEPFADGAQTPVWKISVAPTAGHRVASEILAGAEGRAFFDWQGGLVWLNLADETEAAASIVRGAVAAHGGGHATLIRASQTVRAATATFQPEAAAIAALSQRIRLALDPDGVFDIGRMGGDAHDRAA